MFGGKQQLQALTGLLEAAALSVIETQKRFNLQACADAAQITRRLPGWRNLPAGLQQALLPSVMAVSRTEILIDCEVSTGRSQEVRVGVAPVNLGFSIRYGSREESRTRLQATVIQSPPPAHAATAGKDHHGR